MPPGTRIYAIGDIHGRADLLRGLHDMILADALRAPIERRVAVYLGDYVDRGEDSRQVIDLLLDAPLADFESVHLLGNHEDILLTFLEDASVGPNWVANGGEATLLNYGIGYPKEGGHGERWRLTQQGLRQKLPARHLAFLHRLKLSHVEGDYVFVHAGIRPGLPLERQSKEDLLWIRDEFLSSRANHGKCVVHGHTITAAVDVQSNRIGIDTGAYFSGTLTCLVLEDNSHRLLQT